MMERLTHYQKNGEVAEPYNRSQANEFAKKLAQYEDLEEQGLLVRLPCKVGVTVYQCDCNRVYESNIKNVIYDTDGITFDERAIGKTVFLTREEAEAALRKMESSSPAGQG